MKFIFSLILVYALIFQGFVSSQTTILNLNDVDDFQNLLPYADVEGNVLIKSSFLDKIETDKKLNPIELYPNWPLEYTGSSSRGGIYCNLDTDEELEIIYNVGTQVYAWNIDGTVVSGWPATVQLYPDGAPAFGDIDGDGEGEIVVSSRAAGTGNTGRLMAFHQDGSTVSGFPVILVGGATKTPVLADLNDDGILEIIIEERSYPDGFVAVYSGDGSSFPGFPVALDYIPASAVAVGDITGDNIPEIVAESYYSIIAFDIYGNTLEGFPFTPGNDRVFSYSTPVLADIDGDGIREIIAGDHSLSGSNGGAVHILKSDGTPLTGWPKYTTYWIYGPPAVGDIDGDGNLDIAVGDQVLAGSPSDRVYVWDKDGNNLSGWPTLPMNAINNQIILADLDGDNEVELMWDDNTSANVYIGYNHDGTPMEDWPLSLSGSSFFMNPFVADVNNDGILDLSGASGILTTSNLHFYLWNTDVSVNPESSPLTILQYNVRHDGTYVDASVLNADFSATPVNICEGSETQFNDLSTGNATSWEWEFEGGDPLTSTEQNPIIEYTEAGDFDVSLTVSDGGSTNTISKADYLKVSSEAVIPDLPLGPANFSTDTANFTFYNTWAPNANDYIWELIPDDIGVILEGDTMTEIKIYWSQDEHYSAQLRVKAVNVCGESEFSEQLTIYVNWTTGTNSLQEDKPFEIYPNPNNGEFVIGIAQGLKVENIILFNNLGNQVESAITKCNSEIKIDGLKSGIYFVKIDISEKYYVDKIVVN